MQGQSNNTYQKSEDEDGRSYLAAQDTPNTHAGKQGGDMLAGVDWTGSAESLGGFGKRKNSGSDIAGQTSRGRGGQASRGIGVNRRSRSRSRSKERLNRAPEIHEEDDRTVEDDRRFMYVVN